MFRSNDINNFEFFFEGVNKNLFPVIKYGNIVIRTVLRRDSQIEL